MVESDGRPCSDAVFLSCVQQLLKPRAPERILPDRSQIVRRTLAISTAVLEADRRLCAADIPGVDVSQFADGVDVRGIQRLRSTFDAYISAPLDASRICNVARRSSPSGCCVCSRCVASLGEDNSCVSWS